ncbi:LysR family transcriptional regulator [Sporolactobacillus shoreicorticis]|uniref:LysR family transcriptional regulator n=1 Tax=Sporolactobacillus shoreicorticis TaxID=1923877 RepID=A0ABW5S1R5_9BACL|nr:LysR family transcriptional regulator [Sporolactobacillus shoreicorticis]MCO7125331.1 LysR family transcriptional regulator [Sporolactobacillus shoreicorticis]
MNFEQLKILTVLAQERQFSKVANRLHLTASAVSQAVSKLELELGTTLFRRSRKNTFPTTDGQYIIRIAHIILEKKQEIYDYTADHHHQVKLKIKIGAIPGIIDRFVHLLGLLQHEFPFIEIQMIELNTQNLIKQLREGKFDFALLGFSDALPNYHLPFDLAKLTDDGYFFAVSEQSPLAQFKQLTYAQVVHYPFALYQDSYLLNHVSHIENKTRQSVRVLFETNTMNAIIESVYENMAITFGPYYSLVNSFHDDRRVKVIPMEADSEVLRTYLWFLSSKDPSLASLSQTLLTLIKQELQIPD